MQFRHLIIWLFMLLSIGFAYAGIGNGNACSGPLERALDALHRDSAKRNKLDEKEAGTSYQRELSSAPFEMSVSRMAVKVILQLFNLSFNSVLCKEKYNDIFCFLTFVL